MASFRARIVRAVSGWFLGRVNTATTNVAKARQRFDALTRRLPIARGVRREQQPLAGIYAEKFTPAGAAADRLLLYWHGGGYVLGSCSTHARVVSQLARAAGVPALLPEYRLAPEHRFPAAVDDAVAVYTALLEAGKAAAHIVVAGDSAGGGLAMAMLLRLRERGAPLPAAAVLLSPLLDLATTGESMQTRAAQDPWFEPAHIRFVAGLYADPAQWREPLVSPVYADLGGLPPVFIQVGDDEILLSDSTRLADGIRAAGGSAELEVWPGMWHVFQAFAPEVPEARRAIATLGSRIAAALEAG